MHHLNSLTAKGAWRMSLFGIVLSLTDCHRLKGRSGGNKEAFRSPGPLGSCSECDIWLVLERSFLVQVHLGAGHSAAPQDRAMLLKILHWRKYVNNIYLPSS